METEKLTVKDAMLYPNATLFRDNRKNIKYYNNVFEFIIALSHSSKNFISECKLILRPIGALTEAERSEIFRLRDSTQNGGYICDTDGAKILYHVQKDYADYLRSINIDIDGFIASGKAVAE